MTASTEPLPIVNRSWRGIVVSLRHPGYRLFAFGQLCANVAGWVARIALDWLILDITGSAAVLGAAIALQLVPALLFGPLGGVISDRFSRQRVMLITQCGPVLVHSGLAILVATHGAQEWNVALLLALAGLTGAIEAPSRIGLLGVLVGASALPNAISLTATIFQVAGVLGPLASGVVIGAVGIAPAFGVAAVLSVGALVTTSRMRLPPHAPLSSERRSVRLREGVRYVLDKPALRRSILMVASAAIFGYNLPLLLASVSQADGGGGATGYGIANAIVAAGAIVGSIYSAAGRSLTERRNAIALICYGATMGLIGVAGFAGVGQSLVLAALLGPLGITCLLFVTANDAFTQLSANSAVRGRVISLYVAVATGAQAAGGIALGAIVSTLGSEQGFLAAGLVPLVAGSIVLASSLTTARGSRAGTPRA